MNVDTVKKYLPLIIIFTIIIVATAIASKSYGDATMHQAMTRFMGFFFVVFATFKIINLSNFAQAYAEYDLIAQRNRIYAFTYPFIELSLGILYLSRSFPMVTNLITFALMSFNAIGVAIALSKEKTVVCACLGTVFNIPMTYVTLFEDLLMAGMALIMLFY